jgi:DHA1 family bicyclomycin/chloramphenicol resistance-like MFS transporter
MPKPADFAALLRGRNYVAYMLNAALLTVPYVIFLTVAPTLLIRGTGLSPAAFGLYNLLLVVSILSGSIAAAWLSRRIAIERLVIGASVLAVASLGVQLLLADTLSLWRLLGPFLVYIAAHAVLFPLAVASAIGAYPSMAGTASGVIGFAQTGLGALTLMAVGHFDTTAPFFAVAFSFGAALAGLASLALAQRRRA